MMAVGEDRRTQKLPLFPGSSCLPLSRGNSIGKRVGLDVSSGDCAYVCPACVLGRGGWFSRGRYLFPHCCLSTTDATSAMRRQIKKDQLNVIFDVIGTPSEAEISKARTEEVRGRVPGVSFLSLVREGATGSVSAGAPVPGAQSSTSVRGACEH